MSMLQKMLKNYRGDILNDVYNILTGDDSWKRIIRKLVSSTVKVFQDKPNLTKVIRVRSTSKQMVACFFFRKGHF